jgi:hypothetical protein
LGWFHVIIVIITISTALFSGRVHFDNLGDGLERGLDGDVNYVRNTSRSQVSEFVLRGWNGYIPATMLLFQQTDIIPKAE